MASSMKTITFIISLIAYFIYLSISSIFTKAAIASGSMAYAAAVIYISYALGILVILYTQAAFKYWYSNRQLKSAKVYVEVPLGKFRLVDRLLVYFLPALSVILPIVQTKSLTSINVQSILFLAAIVIIIELLFYVNSKTMRAYITDKGIIVKGIDLRLEIPIPSNYHNPSGYFPYNRIISFLDLNDKLLVEQSHDLGTITLKGNTETLKQAKAMLIANGIRQKRF